MLRFCMIVVVVVALDCSLLRSKHVWAEFWKQEALTHLLQLIRISWSLDGRRWTGQLKTCFFSLDPLSDFTPTPVPTPGTPRKRPKLRNCLYKRCFETWGQCSSALFFISSPAGFQNFQKCNANNELLGSLSCSPQLETNFCFCGFSFAFLLHGTCEHCFVS